MEPKGILRNKEDATPHEPIEGDLDRQEVIRNTRLNAQLSADSTKGDKIRAKIAEARAKDSQDGDKSDGAEHLKWDEINLYQTEQEKAATMKIDEPKTPYTGGFNPEGEYYRDDEEESSQIPDFSLGEGQFDSEDPVSQSINGGTVCKDEEQDEEVEEEPEKEEEILAEEKHRRFEEMRKAHYHLAATPLKHKINVSDDEDD